MTIIFSAEDYEASEQRLVFQPGTTRIAVPIRIFNDQIPEPREQFRLSLFQVIESPTVELAGDRADVFIEDEDGMLLTTSCSYCASHCFVSGSWHFRACLRQTLSENLAQYTLNDHITQASRVIVPASPWAVSFDTSSQILPFICYIKKLKNVIN